MEEPEPSHFEDLSRSINQDILNVGAGVETFFNVGTGAGTIRFL